MVLRRRFGLSASAAEGRRWTGSPDDHRRESPELSGLVTEAGPRWSAAQDRSLRQPSDRFLRAAPSHGRLGLAGLYPGATYGKVDRIRLGVYVAGSILAAIGGLMEAGRVSAVTGQQGYQEGIIFAVFAAAVIGGVSLQGGRGNMVGAASGVILLGLVQNILDWPTRPTTGSRPSTVRSSCSPWSWPG